MKFQKINFNLLKGQNTLTGRVTTCVEGNLVVWKVKICLDLFGWATNMESQDFSLKSVQQRENSFVYLFFSLERVWSFPWASLESQDSFWEGVESRKSCRRFVYLLATRLSALMGSLKRIDLVFRTHYWLFNECPGAKNGS